MHYAQQTVSNTKHGTLTPGRIWSDRPNHYHRREGQALDYTGIVRGFAGLGYIVHCAQFTGSLC